MAKWIITHIVEFLLLIHVLLMSSLRLGVYALAMYHYVMSCPFAEMIASNTVIQVPRKDPTLAVGFFVRGPFYDMPKGRKDGRRLRIDDTINLPAPFFNSSTLIMVFGQRGFSIQELAALSGAARCSSFKNCLSNFESTHNIDPTLNSGFANTQSKAYSLGDNTEVAFGATRTSFDNTYLKALRTGDGVLTSDQTLFASPQTRNHINGYAMNQAMFFFDFKQALLKMGLIDVKEGNKREVRMDCCKVN